MVSWRNEEPVAKAFVVCRNGEEIDTLVASVTCYRDMFHGVAVYSVYTVDVEGHKSPLGIPARCPAGNADREAPVIVINSPVTSVMKELRCISGFLWLKTACPKLYPEHFTIGNREIKYGKSCRLNAGSELSSH